MMDAGGIEGRLAIRAEEWRAGLAEALGALRSFASETERLTTQMNQTMGRMASQLDQVQQRLDSSGRSARTHGTAIRQASEEHKAFSSYVEKSTSSLGGFISTTLRWSVLSTTIGAGIGIIRSGIEGLGEVTVGFNSKLEQSQVRWENLLGSVQAAQAYQGRIQQEALKTPFDFEHLDAGLGRLAAAGVAMRDLIPLTHDLGNALAFSGNMTNEAFDRGVKALSNMQTSIRINSREMNELTRLQIPAWEILASHIGVTTGKLREMVEKGVVNRETFKAAFHEWVTTDVGEIMEKQSKTFLVALSNIRDGLRFTGATAFKPIFDRLEELANRFQTFVQSDEFQAWGTRIASVVEVVMRILGTLGGVFSTVFGTILSTVTTIGQAIYQALQWINPFARHSPSLVESVTEGVATIIERYQSLSAIGDTLTGIGQRIEAFRQITAGLHQIQLDKQTADVGILGPGVAASFADTAQAIAEMAPLIAGLTSDWNDQKQVVAETKVELDEAAKTVREYDNEITQVERDGRSYREQLSEIKDRLVPLKAALAEASQALQDQRNAAQAARDAMDPLKQAYDNATASVQKTRDALSEAKDELNGFLQAPIAGEHAFQDKLAGFHQQLAGLETQIAAIEAKPGKRSAADTQRLDQLHAMEAQVRAQERLLRAQREQVTLPIQQEREAARRGPEMSPTDIRSGIDRLVPQVSSLETTLRSQITAAHDAKAAYDAGIEHAKQLEIVAHGLELAVQARQREVAAVEGEQAGVQREYENNVTRVIDRLKDERQEYVLVHQQIKDRYDEEKTKLDDIHGGLQALTQETRQWQQALNDVHRDATTVLQEIAAAEAQRKRDKAAADRAAKEATMNVASDPTKRSLDLVADIQKLQEQKAAFDAAVADMNKNLQPLMTTVQHLQEFFDGPLGKAIISVATTFLVLRGAMLAATLIVGGIMSTFGLVSVALLGLSEVWNRNFGEIQQITQSFVDGPLEIFKTAAQLLFEGNIPAFLDFFDQAMTATGESLKTTLDYWAKNFLDWVGVMAPPFFEALGGFAVNIVAWVSEHGPIFLKKLDDEWIPAFLDWLENPNTGVQTRVLDILTGFAQKIDAWATAHAQDIEDAFAIWTERVLAFAGHLLEIVVPRLLSWVTGVETWANGEGGSKMDAAGLTLGTAMVNGLMRGLSKSTLAFGNWLRSLVGEAPLTGDEPILRNVAGAATGLAGSTGFAQTPPLNTDAQPIREILNAIADRLDIPHRAIGGAAYGRTLVGERGPEIVDLPGGSYVHSNAESAHAGLHGQMGSAGIDVSPLVGLLASIDTTLKTSVRIDPGGLAEAMNELSSKTAATAGPASDAWKNAIAFMQGAGGSPSGGFSSGPTPDEFQIRALAPTINKDLLAQIQSQMGNGLDSIAEAIRQGGLSVPASAPGSLPAYGRGLTAPPAGQTNVNITNNLRAGVIEDVQHLSVAVGHETATSVIDALRMGG